MSRRALKENEWACNDAKCSGISPDYRNQCRECGKSRPRQRSNAAASIGKEQAEKSKGLFAADDWACSKCGNVNWARRSTCNMCNAKKLADTAPRTGYGGGFMDREEVEYKSSAEIGTQQYDEFGRKIKRAGDPTEGDDGETVERKEREEVRDEKGEEKEKKREENDDDEEEEEDGDDLEGYQFDFDALQPIVKPASDVVEEKAKIEEEECCESDCSCSCSGGSCDCPPSPVAKFEPPSRPSRRADHSSRHRDHHDNRSNRRSRSPVRPSTDHHRRYGRREESGRERERRRSRERHGGSRHSHR